MLTIHSFSSSFPLHLYLASSGVSPLLLPCPANQETVSLRVGACLSEHKRWARHRLLRPHSELSRGQTETTILADAEGFLHFVVLLRPSSARTTTPGSTVRMMILLTEQDRISICDVRLIICKLEAVVQLDETENWTSPSCCLRLWGSWRNCWEYIQTAYTRDS